MIKELDTDLTMLLQPFLHLRLLELSTCNMDTDNIKLTDGAVERLANLTNMLSLKLGSHSIYI
jgi:hypothetical protein